MNNDSDLIFMQRALELAALGRGHVSPNPLVGCVIVHKDKILGEGWHQAYGGPHAEVNAVLSVEKPLLLAEATAYVTLEPCSHFGKTPPCADLLIKHQLKRVVVCNTDPFPLVAGRGIQKLRAAGMAVEVGLLAEQGRELNKRFFTSIEKQRPYVILKWAQTADGFMGTSERQPVAITAGLTNKLVHKWRSEEDAILVGTTTALHDNPRLNVRHWTGRNPLRVVIDKSLRIPETHHLLDNQQRTLVFNDIKDSSEKLVEYCKVPEGQGYLPFILQKLHELNVRSVLVEGGLATHNAFLASGLYDEIRVLTASKKLGDGLPAPPLPLLGRQVEEHALGPDRLTIYCPM